MVADDKTTINVQIDQDALRKQVSEAIQSALTEAAQRLYSAAWALDHEGIDRAFDSEYKAGYEQGLEDAKNGQEE